MAENWIYSMSQVCADHNEKIQEATTGVGDEVMGSGLARGAHARGKRIAFGNGKISWGPFAAQIYRNNPNVAPPGSEGAPDLEWIHFCKGHRIYNELNGRRWAWNFDFKAKPGELFFDETERRFADQFVDGAPFVVVEPNVEWHKSVAPNKDWGAEKYQAVVDNIGFPVVQFLHKNSRNKLKGVTFVSCNSFRQALAILKQAKLYIGPEGGMHHGAAATETPAVVLFGGFIPAEVVGYAGHANLTGGADACGSLDPCRHCFDAMSRISVDEVFAAATERLQ